MSPRSQTTTARRPVPRARVVMASSSSRCKRSRCIWKTKVDASSCGAGTPPEKSRVAASGTVTTRKPNDSRRSLSMARAVVLPPHGPPVSTTRYSDSSTGIPDVPCCRSVRSCTSRSLSCACCCCTRASSAASRVSCLRRDTRARYAAANAAVAIAAMMPTVDDDIAGEPDSVAVHCGTTDSRQRDDPVALTEEIKQLLQNNYYRHCSQYNKQQKRQRTPHEEAPARGEKSRRCALSAPSPAYRIRGSHRPHHSSWPDVACLLLERDGPFLDSLGLGIKHNSSLRKALHVMHNEALWARAMEPVPSAVGRARAL
eukprot:scaffold1223_cov136-Isochrysis_galbana.AAC.5